MKGGSSNFENMTNTVLAETGFDKDIWNNKVNYFYAYSKMDTQQFGFRLYDIDGFTIAMAFDDAFLREFSARLKPAENPVSEQ